jgi:hypothetical protein
LWTVAMDECPMYHSYAECLKKGQGTQVQVRISSFTGVALKSCRFIFQVLDVQRVETGFPNRKITVWKMEKVDLVENRIWPICLFNKGNHFDSEHALNYTLYAVSIFLEAKKHFHICKLWTMNT